MKRNYKKVLIVAVLVAAMYSFMPRSIKTTHPDKDRALIELIDLVIQRYHFSPFPIDDAFSKSMYKDYITALDPSRRFFLQSDIDEFAKYESLLDDQINNRQLSFFDLTYNRLMQRIDESQAYYKEILDNPIDYTVDESIDTDYEKLPYAQNVKELKNRWRLQLKLNTLNSLVDKLDLQEGKKNVTDNENEDDPENPTAKAKKDAIVEVKSFDDLEKEVRKNSMSSLNEYFSFIKDLDREDWFSVYLNSMASQFDPHTNYFPPEDKERFDIGMSGKLEGIGARLQKKNDYTEITELISGGPAWRGKELEPGDAILKVAQGNEEPVDVVGMRLEDVVKKIKGPKGTEVRLSVKKQDGSTKVISIVRDEVEIDETYAKSAIIQHAGKRYGLIYLPKFYISFEDRNSRDAAKDVAQEIERLKKENIDGLIFDVRDNGGGSLSTVVDIAGLFIEQGPIVQVKASGKRKDILADRNPKIAYDGPLVVMVNSFSASASEILAAAIQDYGRGVIIGSKQTYGKGTVQNLIDLNQFMRNSDMGDMGAFKTTTQKFYRINGGSTQLEGVHSDIHLPDRYSYVKMGERDIEKAMKWDKIDPAPFQKWKDADRLADVIKKGQLRAAQNDLFKLIDENAKWLEERSEVNVYHLNLEKFRKEQEAIQAKSEKYKALKNYKNDLKLLSLPYELEVIKKDELLKEKRERWHESLTKDIYLEEAVLVLDDLAGMSTKITATPTAKKK